MNRFVALLRAVNVGGTGRLPMADLKAMCEAAGFACVRTYIVSGNVVFENAASAQQAKAALEARLHCYAGKSVGVVVRTDAEMAGVLAGNPFADDPGNRVAAIFMDDVVSTATLEGVTGLGANEAVRLGLREVYVRYGDGMAGSTLRIPAAARGTARNMNTVAKLVAMLSD